MSHNLYLKGKLEYQFYYLSNDHMRRNREGNKHNAISTSMKNISGQIIMYFNFFKYF